MTNELRIKTTYSPDQITQEVAGAGPDWRSISKQVLAVEVIRLKDQGVREALIRMGWTPPRNGPEVKPVRMCIIQQSEHEHSITSYARIEDFQRAREGMILATKAVEPT